MPAIRRLGTALATIGLTLTMGVVSPGNGAAHGATAVNTVSLEATYGDHDDKPFDKDRLLKVSQGGYLTLENLHLLRDHVAEFAELGIREIRVDHVFDDEFYGVVKSDGTYDFSKLDDTLQPFLNHGIKPWISLSYMPRALRKFPAELFSPPKDNAAWGRAVKAMVAHYAGKGYTGWNWEVWNEPDLFWGKEATRADYLAMYAATAKAVKEADGSAQVGGPAVTHAGSALLTEWLNFIDADPGVPWDFVSWHDYGHPNWTSVATVRDALLSRDLPVKKLYVTEWHADHKMGVGGGTWPDTHQSASYAAHRIYESLSRPELSGAFFFTGIEGWNPSRNFNGDLGMITADGRRKAVGNVFAMMKSMGATRLKTTMTSSAGNAAHGLVTTNPENKKVSILLWNNVDDKYATFTLLLKNLPYAETNMAVTKYDVNGIAGNSWYDETVGLSHHRPSPNERLRPASQVVKEPTRELSTTQSLGPNAVILIELSPTEESVGAKPVPPVATTVNLARGKTVSWSSQYTEAVRGWLPAAVVDGRRYSYAAVNDGNPTMGWTSREHTAASVPGGEYLQVDLGSSQSFDTVTLWPRSDQAADGRAFPADFVISGSADGVTWDPLVTKTGHGAGAPVSGPQHFAVGAGVYRYVRVTATHLGLPLKEWDRDVYRFQLAELEVTKQIMS
ncbi:Beta-xylosidase [Nonomuraea solani]|uniref:Beta-xylosidase n=1 Tax=Nonomuraea solani TaxID=1144553 RepID=A0A1H6EDP5_9ACTN|nr:discoidin domain-containing protein [Nonomuraea solani]SEG95892.1 Beta-xylosidase [Nonomuraea solani]